MKRRMAALLACAWMAFGQRSSPLPAVTPPPLIIDAVAVDASGRPVADLTAEDFEVELGGRARKITNFTWFDTRLHTAVSQAGQLAALDLLPDEIRRNLVVVIDDLGLTSAGIDGVRDALREFVVSGMSSGDRMAILRTSGGSGVLQQLTGDTRTLVNAIDGIRYLGGGIGGASAGKAAWLTLRYALEGLRDFPGRKVVVLFAENPGAAGPWMRAEAEVAQVAHAAAATVYVVDAPAAPGGATAAPGVLESLARDTGGWFGGDFARVLLNEQGYYAIGFQPEEDSTDAAARRFPVGRPEVKVRRPGVVVRWRAGYVSQPARVELLTPAEHGQLSEKALRSPFACPDVPARLTALFSDYPAGGPIVEAILHYDPRSFSFIHDLQDMYHGAVQLRVMAYRDDGLSTAPRETASQLTLRPAEYRHGMENGLKLTFQMRLPGPGVWQIRTLVADGASDRMGSATQFVEIPNVIEGGLALSGLTLSDASAEADSAPADPQGDAGVRIFKPGQNCTFLYSVFNALTGMDKQSTLEVVARIFAGGRVVFDGKPGQVKFGGTPQGSRRLIKGQFKVDARMAPGDFVLQVTVRDTLASPGHPRTATVFTDFQIRE